MTGDKVPEILEKFYRDLPHFPDGRIDYTNSEKAPTVVSFLKCGGEILLLKRSDRVRTHKNVWSVVAGYLDELKPISEKALMEVEEETGISREEISSIQVGEEIRFEDEGKTWVSYPVLMELEEKPNIELDWEHGDYKWVKIEDTGEYFSSRLSKGLEGVLSL